jgi:hypothetical protein
VESGFLLKSVSRKQGAKDSRVFCQIDVQEFCFQAVNDILGDMDTSEYGADPTSEEQQQEVQSSGEDSTRLFPIFYKASGGQEQNSGATITSTSTRTGGTGEPPVNRYRS